MAFIKVKLTEVTDTSFPAFGKFVFTDASGEAVVIHEKLPVVGLDFDQVLVDVPMDVTLECKVASEARDTVLIDTSEPHGIADIHGNTRFNVSAELVLK